MLLHWGTLEPQGPSKDLAAIRFSTPVHVRSIRIFPSGSHPFASSPEIVAQTEPGAMYLDVFLTAQPIAGPDGKQKQKATNVLTSTTLAYCGEQAEFAMDVGSEFTTRLMIVRGNFTSLSLAIYGDTSTENQTELLQYEPKAITDLEYTLPIPALDLSSSTDPIALARNLLALSPDTPDLKLITRLMFCLKPTDDDWEEPDFPYLFASLDGEFSEFDLAKAINLTSRPVSDSVDEALLREFAIRVAEVTNTGNDDHAYLFAKLLSQCASQHSLFVVQLLEHASLPALLSVANLNDKSTLGYLLDACANVDVSKSLSAHPQVLEALLEICRGYGYGNEVRETSRNVLRRIKGWEMLEDALSNTQATFAAAVNLLRDITKDENSFGTWLQTMISHPELISKLTENPVPLRPMHHPPCLWKNLGAITRDDFVAFVRALIGVAAVIAVYAWSDSVPIEECRAKALSILRLWHTMEGYADIVHHLLLIRQMTYRLECMLPQENALPAQASMDAEHILRAMALRPQSMLRIDFVNVMHNLGRPLNVFSDEEISTFVRVADTAHDGLSAAVQVICGSPEMLDSALKVLEFRVATATVSEVLQESTDGERQLVEALWKQGRHSIAIYLIQHLSTVAAEIAGLFTVSIPVFKSQADMAALFETGDEILDILPHLLPLYPVPGRSLSSLAHSLADIFIAADSADTTYAQSSEGCIAAHAARQACINVLTLLTSVDTVDENSYSTAVAILKALLRHAMNPGIHDAGHHVGQIFWLVDHALPVSNTLADPKAAAWLHGVIPHLLGDLKSFYGIQESENRAHLIRRFADLDRGSIIGVAEWLLVEEMTLLHRALLASALHGDGTLQHSLARWHIGASLKILTSLVEDLSALSTWTVDVIVKDSEASARFSDCIKEILNQGVYFASMTNIVLAVAARGSSLPYDVLRLILLLSLRATRCHILPAFLVASSLLAEGKALLDDEGVRLELSGTLETLVVDVRNETDRPDNFAVIVATLLATLASRPHADGTYSLTGLGQETLGALLGWVAEERPDFDLSLVKGKVTVSAGKPLPPVKLLHDSSVSYSLNEWEGLLSPPIPIPSTPKRRSPAQSAEMIGLVTVSPPNALLRSPEVKGLTKTYNNNDFRQLRQTSTRQNTSRLPSMHVDDFESGGAGLASSPPPASFGSPPQPLSPVQGIHPKNFQLT